MHSLCLHCLLYAYACILFKYCVYIYLYICMYIIIITVYIYCRAYTFKESVGAGRCEAQLSGAHSLQSSLLEHSRLPRLRMLFEACNMNKLALLAQFGSNGVPRTANCCINECAMTNPGLYSASTLPRVVRTLGMPS
jgi:hypothetical protein